MDKVRADLSSSLVVRPSTRHSNGNARPGWSLHSCCGPTRHHQSIKWTEFLQQLLHNFRISSIGIPPREQETNHPRPCMAAVVIYKGQLDNQTLSGVLKKTWISVSQSHCCT